LNSSSPASANASPVEIAVDEAQERYAAANPRSSLHFRRARASLPGGNTRTALHFDPFPLAVARSEGAFITDLDGHAYLDVLGEYSAGLYGHSPAVVIEAARLAAASGIANGAPGFGEIDLAEQLCARFPGIERLRFCNSGTEANLYSLMLARAATGRTRLVGFSGAYHGAVLSLGRGNVAMNVPFEWMVLRYNDSAGCEEALAVAGSEVAAVIVEPMMSNGGCLPATAQFLSTLRSFCDRYGAILIFDEVVTSRMGRGGMQHRLGVIPDLTTLGKYIGGGYPLAAFGGRSGLIDLLDPTSAGHFVHSGTFNNHAVSTQAGAAALRTLFPPERADAFYDIGEALRGRLNALALATGRAVQFTGCGSVMNIHFVAGPLDAPEDLEVEPKHMKSLFHLDLLADGVYCARRGQINLSLPMEAADIRRIEASVAAFLHQRHMLLPAL
jgi:glutamate-1-semialdehyde 2,1-aminomutase